MTLSEYQDTYSWQGAIELAPQLLTLAEELPAAEEMALSLQLRQLMVELPAGIAASLVAGSLADLSAPLRLISVLEIVERIYPALDTAAVRTAADALVKRLAGSDFTEVKTAPVAQAALPETPETPAAETPVVPDAPEAPATDFANPAPAPAVSVAVATESEETDVHPDSLQ
jgi:hypothetical protein